MDYQIKENYNGSQKLLSKRGVKQVLFDHSLRKFEVEGEEGWKLFPYQIKNREKFYYRDHPKQINPKSQVFKNYWTEGVDCFAKKAVEGIGVDDEGTWIYMPNKLFYYTNYIKIVNDERQEIHPDLSTLEWAGGMYIMCVDGFSGMSKDKEFTCNHYVKRLWDGEEVEDVEMEMIPDHCYKDKEKGVFKIYVDPWEYLTRFYLIDNPRGDLGVPLYANPRSNGQIFGARGVAKSFLVFMMDFMWEWTFGGIPAGKDQDYAYNYRKNRHESKNRLLFAMGAGKSEPLERSIANIKSFYDIQPGKFEYPQSSNPKNRRPDYMGPFYKAKTGTWGTGNKIQHVVKTKTGTSDIEGSMVQTSILTKDNKKVAAGDRFRRIYVEESGFIEYLLDIHAANKDSLKVGSNKVGSIYYLGCVCKGTKILTTRGFLNVEDVLKTDRIYGYDEMTEIPYNYVITKHLEPKPKPCFRITTTSGRELECSYDHPIMTLYKRGPKDTKFSKLLPMYTHTGEITTAHYLGVPEFCEGWGDTKIEDPYLVGCLLGDGTYGAKQQPGIISESDEVWDYIGSKYDYSIYYQKIGKSGKLLRKGNIKGIIPMVKKLGMRGQTKLNKKIPQAVYTCNKSDFLKFVAGYFDADGCYSIDKSGYTTIKVTSICKEIIQDLQILLNRIGVHGRIVIDNSHLKPTTKGKHPTYNLVIKDKSSLINFCSNIEPIIGYKKENKDKILKIAEGKSNIGGPLKKNGLRFERVLTKEYIGEKDVYNFTVAGPHSYLANGLVTHNTAGEMESIMAAKTMFENPKGYDIFGVTDYFKNPNRKIGYFIPAYMKFREFNDPQGNTRYEFCLKKILKQREKDAKEMDSVSFDSEIMYNPIVPTEMLRPSRRSILPVREAQQRLSDIEAYGLFDYKANIGRLSFNPNEKSGVKFEKDVSKVLRPIIKYNVDENKIDKKGAVIIYEQPPEYIPENLYWVVYDPAAKSGDGGSFHSVLVYKHFYSSTEKTMEDAIVAEWIGREETLDLNYEKVVRIAKYFNAKIFPEINVAGFVEWANRMNYYTMLQPSSLNLEKELNPKYRAGYYKVGFQMNERKKTWALQRLHDWLMEPKERDPVSNIPITRNIDYVFSPRVLDEVVNYTEKGNYDHISSLLGLMILFGQLDSQDPISMEEKKKPGVYDFQMKAQTTKKRRRSSFEQF